ncbi:hypothetical protein NESM_000505200 [Novymonas esmeraldas]|uniref:Uncharacterized protein n=1 Tax=Novymonas esmeraldas TaxID=1808958 RepID=A0AAW0ERD5_9TRYP
MERRPLSQGDTRSRGERDADLNFCHHRHSALHAVAGDHSLWCDLVLVEVGCRPVEATAVVLVVTSTKVLLRVAATGFTLTVYLRDVVQVRRVGPANAVELHVVVPATAAPHGRASHGTSAVVHRLYRVRPSGCGGDRGRACGELFHLLSSALPPSLQPWCEEADVDDAVAWYLQPDACAMLPPELLEQAGLREWSSDPYTWNTGATRTAADRSASPPVWRGEDTPTAHAAASARRRPLAPMHLADATHEDNTGHLRTIYVAPSPSFWRLPRSAQRVPHERPASAVAGVADWAATAAMHTRPTQVSSDANSSIDSREPPMAALQDERRHRRRAVPASAPSSPSWMPTQPPLHVEYGPITSG